MKKTIALVMLGIVGNVFAFQPHFEIEYTNYAWGYDNRGCLIDAEGNVYKYGYGHSSDGKGLVPSGKMSEADLLFANDLVEKISHGKYSQEIVGADAGNTVWSAHTRYGQRVQLQVQGDSQGKNDAPETAILVSLLNGLCNYNR